MLEENLLQSFCVWKMSATELWGIHWSLYKCINDRWGTSPSTWKFGRYWLTPLQKADFQSIFARSASAITASEKLSINTTRKSTMHCPVRLTWIVYTVSQKKTKQICFCHNFVKFPQISIIFGRKMGNDPNICEVHSFSTSPNLRHHLTVWNTNVPSCYIMPNVVICNKLLTT